MVKRAIILAAGQCKRLRPHTDNTPKCLLDISGKNLLGRQIEMLTKNGINDIYIVVGYLQEQIRDYVLKEYPDVNINYIMNEEYDTTNNGYSLQLALEQTDNTPFLLLNADVVCHSDIIAELLNDKHKNCMAIQRKPEVIVEDMKVQVEDKLITTVSKELLEAIGEFTGIAKITDTQIILNKLRETGKNEWFEKALDDLIKAQKINFFMTDVTHYPTMEVDFAYDLEVARDLFPWGQPDWEFGIRHESAKRSERIQDDAWALLKDTIECLERYNIKYWINWGTLLGLYRDKQFIPWDTDIDVTCHMEDRWKVINLVEPLLKKLGCFIPKEEVCYPEDRWYIRDMEKIELNFVEDVGDKYCYSPERSKLACPKAYIDNLDALDFRERKLPIPSNTAKYLELSYGTNWNIPIKGKKPVSL